MCTLRIKKYVQFTYTRKNPLRGGEEEEDLEEDLFVFSGYAVLAGSTIL